MACNTLFVTPDQLASKHPQHTVTCTPAHLSTLGTPQESEVYKAPGSEKLKCGIKPYSVIFASCAPDLAWDNALSRLLISQSQGNPDEEDCHKGKQEIQLVVVKRIPERKLIGKLRTAPLWLPSTSCSHWVWAQLRIQPKELLKLMACKFFKQSNLCSWEEQSWSASFPPADSFKGICCDFVFRKNEKYQDKMGAVKCRMFFTHHGQTRTWLLKSFTLRHLHDCHCHTFKIEQN